MDRFIALGIDTKKLDNAGLKSNMDRFIGNQLLIKKNRSLV